MKNRAFAATVFLLGTFILAPLGYTAPSVAPKNATATPFHGNGPDIAEDAWQNWQAPVGTVDPSRLIPSDSTNSIVSVGVSASHSDSFTSDSFQLANSLKEGTSVQIEESKPIEKVEGNIDSVEQPASLTATATPRTSSSSKRVIVIAVFSVAILAYRKFRPARPHPPKPNFL